MRCKLSTRCNHLPPHWLEHGKTFVKFAMVGAAGLVVNLASFTFFLHLGINKYLASPMAIELSIINNFIFNNFWTFRSRQETKMLLTRAFRFNIVSFLTLFIRLKRKPY